MLIQMGDCLVWCLDHCWAADMALALTKKRLAQAERRAPPLALPVSQYEPSLTLQILTLRHRWQRSSNSGGTWPSPATVAAHRSLAPLVAPGPLPAAPQHPNHTLP